MKKSPVAANADAYVAGLKGWRGQLVGTLRAAILGAAKVEESVKWGHLVFSSNGPVLLVRAESKRVLFGFWRGQRLGRLEPRLKPSGGYEMATIELREGDTVAPAVVRRLVKQAVALNKKFGDPRLAAKRDKKNEEKA
jgi:hypothetical protein